MCGILGLRLKRADWSVQLGQLVAPMLEALAARGPDSAGLGIYRSTPETNPPSNPTNPPSNPANPTNPTGNPADPPASSRRAKYSLGAPSPAYDWSALEQQVGRHLGVPTALEGRGPQALLVAPGEPDVVRRTLHDLDPSVRIFAWGEAIELLKDVGPAAALCERYGVRGFSGFQAIGHTRMATESAVSIEASHPFCAGPDLALVHNGSFSNYATIRRDLQDLGVRFDTDNDSEVAARFVAARLEQHVSLGDALREVMKVFDGFFTLLVTTTDCFAVLRDSMACKPMVIAETGDYVAAATEYIALAHLPGIENADVFEPLPEEVYTWG